MSLAGKFSTMSIADLIQWGRTAQRTGLLRVMDGNGKEIQVVFRDGRIVLSGTNDKRERWGAYLIFHDYCTQKDLDEAFRAKEITGASVASILVRERKITQQQAITTLTDKTIEDLCDVFLWREGEFAFEPKIPAITSSLTIDLDPIHVVCEGVRRADVWSRLSAIIHLNNVFDPTDEPFDESGPWEDAAMARHVLRRLDGDLTVRDLLDQIPFSRYKVFRALSELLERRLIRPSDVTAAADREKRTRRKVEDAQQAASAGRWTEAMEILQGLITVNPGRADLVEKLLEITRGFERAIYQHNFAKEDVPVVTIGPDALARVNIDSTDAFLLSRIDGRLTVRDILRICPVSEVDGLRAFKRLLSAKVIDFPSRA